MSKNKSPKKRRPGMSLWISEAEREYLHAAAKAAGHDTTSKWIKVVLRLEAKKILGRPSPALTDSEENGG